jgi:hypothetical protein
LRLQWGKAVFRRIEVRGGYMQTADETSQKILYIATHGPGGLEHPILPFVLASAALFMGVQAVVALQGDAVSARLHG